MDIKFRKLTANELAQITRIEEERKLKQMKFMKCLCLVLFSIIILINIPSFITFFKEKEPIGELFKIFGGIAIFSIWFCGIPFLLGKLAGNNYLSFIKKGDIGCFEGKIINKECITSSHGKKGDRTYTTNYIFVISTQGQIIDLYVDKLSFISKEKDEDVFVVCFGIQKSITPLHINRCY